MALPVVDSFQVVEVDHHHRQAPLMALGECDLALHETLKLAAVGEAGQVIGA